MSISRIAQVLSTNQSPQELRRRLDQISDFLDRNPLFTITPQKKQRLRGTAESLAQKIASIESRFLRVGLLGGTGVGKSSLMNALAGSQIASTSHRRPHTDKVLIYRHAEAPSIHGLDLGNTPWEEIIHTEPSVQQILLCDLPDFDSLLAGHREHVLRFLEHLDILIWVASPEKYADGRFYEFLRFTPKAKLNYYFVLNKVDLLFGGEAPEIAYEQMAGLVGSFKARISANGIDNPILYALSAEEALRPDQPAPWNQFPAFKQLVFQQRDIKQVLAIKEANLGVEIQTLLSAFQKERLTLEGFEKILASTLVELQQAQPQWRRFTGEAIERWLHEIADENVLSYYADPSNLIGPGYAIGLLFQGHRNRFANEKGSPGHLARVLPHEEISGSFRRQLEWLEDRLNHQILRDDLPSAFQAKLHDVLNVPKISDDLRESLSNLAASRISEPPRLSFWTFRTRQHFTYWLLLAFLLIALGGETPWREVVGNPGGTSFLSLILSWVHTVFSTKGIAALGSYVLLNLLVAFRFYRRFRRIIRRAGLKMISTLQTALEKLCDESFDCVEDNLNALCSEIQSQLEAMTFTSPKEKAAEHTSTTI